MATDGPTVPARMEDTDHAIGNDIAFILNRAPVHLRVIDPAHTLLDYLRSANVALTGTKLSCGEGGCGACTVMAAYRASDGTVSETIINACLRPLCSIDGMSITTTEGLGNSKNLNPIQRRLAEYNGSQCGYCSPGFVMSMYGLLRDNATPTKVDVEDQFDGNLCRCTGFRPILDAMQSFVGDADATALARGNDAPLGSLDAFRRLSIKSDQTQWHRVLTVSEALELLSLHPGGAATLVNGNTAAGIYKLERAKYSVYVDISRIDVLTRIQYIESERRLEIGSGVTFGRLLKKLLEIASSSSGDVAKRIEVIAAHIKRIAGHQVRSVATVGGNIALVLAHSDSTEPFPSDLFTILATLGATVYLQSLGSLEPKAHSILDLASEKLEPNTFLITHVSLSLPREGSFFNTYKIARRPQNSHAIVNAGFYLELTEQQHVHRVCLVFGGLAGVAREATRTQSRMEGQSWNEETLRFVIETLASEVSEFTIDMPNIGVGIEYRRALATSLFYKFFLQVSLVTAPNNVSPRFASAALRYERPISSGKHGTILAPYVQPGGVELAVAPYKAIAGIDTSVAKLQRLGEGRRRLDDVALKLMNSLASGNTEEVAGASAAPMTKIGAELQATGEAKYTQDLWPPGPTLFAHYILSERASATFKFTTAPMVLADQLRSRLPGVRSIVTSDDIPNPPATNRYDPTDPGRYDPIFASNVVTAIGQPIGVVVAESAREAMLAASLCQDAIQYDVAPPVPPPVLTIKDAVAAASFLHPGTSLNQIVRPNGDMAWIGNPQMVGDEIQIEGTQRTGAQAHFYMETQGTLAIPAEGQEMLLYCSSQHLGKCQEVVANALRYPVAKVRAHALRVGGGFGGKEVRPPFFAAAAAVAAYVVQLPVRLALDRNTDMQMVGKRHAFEGSYVIGSDKQGKIARFKVNFDANAGFSYDCTLPVTDLVLLSADAAYGIPTFSATRRACRTNLQTNTAMRSFGVIQCTLIVEDAIEKLSHKLGMPAETLRERNFYRDSTVTEQDETPYGQTLVDCRLNQVWSDFKQAIDFDERRRGCEEFNGKNRWRKRAIAMIPIKYGISYTYLPMNQGGAQVIAFSNDGTVVVKHGGVEMGQGIHTKMARLAADTLGIDLALITVAGSDTQDIGNAPSTGASTGTDLNGGAVLEACGHLRDRLVALCRNNPKAPQNWETQWQTKWPEIIKFAFGSRVDLSAEALFASKDLGTLDKQGRLEKGKRLFYYFTYSVAASEVELDVLTGESTILRADIVYDSGKTINSTLDYGQIEGGFVQGLGNVTTEQIYFNDDGKLLSDGTWNYKIPCSKSIPVEFNVNLLDYVPRADARTPLDTYGIRSAKSTGEPPLVLASSAFFAIKAAIREARLESGLATWVELDSPATVERIQNACRVRNIDLSLTEPDPPSVSPP